MPSSQFEIGAATSSGTPIAAPPGCHQPGGTVDNAKLKELILQSLEHERGGVKIYETALKCVQNEDLKEEWEKYHQETERHVQILHDVCAQMQIDPEEQSPGRKIVHDMGMAYVSAMEAALGAGDPAAAEIVACECVSLAEQTDHSNWELIGECSKKLTGAEGKALKDAYKEVEDQEDEHYYHSKGWLRELSMQALGLKAVLPPPEERKHVKTAIGAARAEQERTKMR
jgi:rubrerythrin